MNTVEVSTISWLWFSKVRLLRYLMVKSYLFTVADFQRGGGKHKWVFFGEGGNINAFAFVHPIYGDLKKGYFYEKIDRQSHMVKMQLDLTRSVFDIPFICFRCHLLTVLVSWMVESIWSTPGILAGRCKIFCVTFSVSEMLCSGILCLNTHIME